MAKTKNNKVFEGQPALVNIQLSSTLNMGDFESLKISAGLTMPCKPTMAEIDKTFEIVFKKVEKQLAKRIKQMTGRG